MESNGTMSRAAKFEDEKRRINETCFKKDVDGTGLESYITHIRVIEDSQYPSSPPPPDSDSRNKKPRVVIIAVRKSGKVRMHKARENTNGSFSIGKSWDLDALSAVQSFNGATPTTPEEEQWKQWAGGIGFTVTLGKPYYWQANTPKEKQFFIGSLVKIYTKYTGGNLPNLIGFDQRERDQIVGAAGQTRQGPPGPQTRPPPPPNSAAPPSSSAPYGQLRSPRPGEAPGLRKEPSRPTEPPASMAPTTYVPGRPQLRTRREDSNDSAGAGYGAGPGAASPSQAHLRRLPGVNPGQESFGRTDESGSGPPRSRGGLNVMPGAAGRFQDRNPMPSPQSATSPDRERPFTRDPPSASTRDPPNEAPSIPAPLSVPPERRRPPMPNALDIRNRGFGSNENLVPAPLASPQMRREEVKPPERREEVKPSERNRDRSQSKGSLQSAQTNMPPPVTPSDEPSPAKEKPPPTMLPVEASGPPASSDSMENLNKAPSVTPVEATVTSPVSDGSPAPKDEERPGLGPMIKKKSKIELASRFKQAARAANAFKPRAGGAAEKLYGKEEKPSEGPDGITGVVPAPSLLRALSNDVTKPPQSTPPPETAAAPTPETSKAVAPAPEIKPEIIPEVKITVPQSNRPSSKEGPVKPAENLSVPEKAKGRESKSLTRATAERVHKELEHMGVDPSVVNDKGIEFMRILEEYGWVGEGVHTKNIVELQGEIERDLDKAQAAGWVDRMAEEDDRIEAITKGIDKVLGESDELDGLLTLYSVELGTLYDDVAYIEAQSQGLQVQTANQKLLQTELQNLLATVSISSTDLQSLREASLESPRGLEQIESALVTLFKAMVAIDPTLSLSASRAGEDGAFITGVGGLGTSEIGNMRIVQEKKEDYRAECVSFIHRLKIFLQIKFAAAIDETRQAISQQDSMPKRPGKPKLDPRVHDLARSALWRYSPMMLFVREVDRMEWDDMMKLYEGAAKPLYQEEFRNAVFEWKRTARKPTGDEADLLFSSQTEKESQSITTTARKLTVKRSQTLAKTLRGPIGDGSKPDRSQDGKLGQYEVFGYALDEMLTIMSLEQNFFVEFFHASSLEQLEFPDAVMAAPPEARSGGNLAQPKIMDPNRDLAKRVVQAMDELYAFWTGDMQSLISWTMQAAPLQGVGALAALERKMLELEESNQEFLSKTLQKLHSRLSGLFTKFLDEQIRAIEDTKVKIKKRKGVIAFMRLFPAFASALELMLVSAEDLEIRETVNNAYVRINKTMFESLKVIARENPTAQMQSAMGDPEDKEALNYQILLIENMNHYLEEVDARNNPVLEEWKEKASREMDEHMSLYLGAVIRRPLGKLLDYLESTESLLQATGPGSPASIAGRPSHSKAVFKKLLSTYDSKEIRRGIETLKKRVEKHFGDADDPNLSRGLVVKVLQNCERYYEEVESRVAVITRDVYEGDGGVEWTKLDVTTAFRR